MTHRFPSPSFILAAVALGLAITAPGCGSPGQERPTVVLAGKVLGADGNPPRKARVAVTTGPRLGSRELALVEPGEDGSFTIEVPGDVPCFLRIAAVDHRETAVPVYLEPEEGGATVTVRLARNPFVENPERVRLTGSWLEFNWREAVEMNRRKDGTWTWEGQVQPGDDGRVSYQLLDIVPGHSVNGTDAVDFEYDGGGDWTSIVEAPDGRVRIVFDPAKLPPAGPGDLPRVAWDGKHRWLSDLFELRQEGRAVQSALFERYRELEGSGRKVTEKALGDMMTRLVAYRERLAKIAAADGPVPYRAWVASHLLAAFLPGDIVDDQGRVARELRAAWDVARPLLPATSPFWIGVDSWTLYRLARAIDGDEIPALLEALARDNPVRDVRGQAMLALLRRADEARDEQAARRWWNELSQRYGDERAYQWDLKRFDPDRRIAVGRPVPSFEVTTLDGRRLTDRDLRGKVVLLDFWATWCGPCISEMPHLHEAWRRYHDRGFEVVSFSLDASPDAVREFRRGEWKMPWTHVFLEGGFGSEVARAFEISSIPEPILVGRDGTIVAVAPETRGSGLLAAVERALGAETR